MTKKEKDVKEKAIKAAKILLECCFKHEINNPKIMIDMIVEDSTEKYKLTFERTDLD